MKLLENVGQFLLKMMRTLTLNKFYQGYMLNFYYKL